MSEGPASSEADEPGSVGRRATWAALLLVGVPLLGEAAALDPSGLAAFREPVFAAARLAGSHALPWLAAAVSAGALAQVLARRAVTDRVVPDRGASGALLAVAAVLGGVAAWATPNFADALRDGEVEVAGDCVRVGGGGPLARCVPVEPTPLEDAGGLASAWLPARSAPEPVAVRWVGARDQGPPAPGTRVELVAGGVAEDVTAAWTAMAPGGARVFSHVVRVGPEAGRVRLRMADDPTPPTLFFDAARALDVEGMALVAGGGDRAWRVEQTAAPGAAGAAVLGVAGTHVAGGHLVVVVSGERWGVHDLGPLRTARGALQIETTGPLSPDWAVRLVGDGTEGEPVPLSAFVRVEEGELTRWSLPLAQLPLGPVPEAAVVGVALAWAGAAGDVSLGLVRVRAAIDAAGRSGFALGTLASLDPGARPAEAMFVVGDPSPGPLSSHAFALRAVAAGLALVGALGPRTLAGALRLRPVATPIALAAGPLLAALAPAALRFLAAPRLEHLPLALAATAAGLSVARARPASPSSHTAGGLGVVEAASGLAVIGVVALHVSADPFGQPWPDATVAARAAPALLHAVAAVFGAPLLVLATLYGLAHALNASPASRPARALVARLVPAMLTWSAAYLVIRGGKAVAFGYEEAWRRELAEGATWVHAALLGGAQYHLPLLPVLLGLVLLFPAFLPASRRPWLGLGLVATLAAWPSAERAVYEAVASPEARAFALHGVTTAAWLGFGWVAFALAGGRAWTPAVTGAVGLVGLACVGWLLRDGWSVATTGEWPPASLPGRLAAHLAPAALFAWMVASGRAAWPGWLRWLGRHALGLYLVHPALLDLAEVAERGLGLPPAVVTAANFILVLGASALLVAGMSRVRALRFALGERP